MVPRFRGVTLVVALLWVSGVQRLSVAAQTPAGGPPLDKDAICQPYDPKKIQVVQPSGGPFTNSAWKIESAGLPLEQAADQNDADRVASLALFYSVECKIVSNRPLIATVTYWKEPTRPLALPFDEDCRSYNPAKLTATRTGIREQLDSPIRSAGRLPFAIGAQGPKEAEVVLAVARQWTTACVIGGWGAPALPDGSIWANMSAPEKKQAEDRQNAWHPVYYWKR